MTPIKLGRWLLAILRTSTVVSARPGRSLAKAATNVFSIRSRRASTDLSPTSKERTSCPKCQIHIRTLLGGPRPRREKDKRLESIPTTLPICQYLPSRTSSGKYCKITRRASSRAMTHKFRAPIMKPDRMARSRIRSLGRTLVMIRRKSAPTPSRTLRTFSLALMQLPNQKNTKTTNRVRTKCSTRAPSSPSRSTPSSTSS